MWKEYFQNAQIYGFEYDMWIANPNCAFLSRVVDSLTRLDVYNKGMPMYTTRVRFAKWLDIQIGKPQKKRLLHNKIEHYLWTNIVNDYIKLSNAGHYSKWAIANYAQDIIDIIKDSQDVLPKEEIDKIVKKHLSALHDISKKAIKELDTQLDEIQRQEDEYKEAQKELQRKLIKSNEELLVAKYSEYTKDFGLEK